MSTGYSSRGSRFDLQHPQGGIHPSVTPVPGNPVLFCCPPRKPSTHIYTDKALINTEIHFFKSKLCGAREMAQGLRELVLAKDVVSCKGSQGNSLP